MNVTSETCYPCPCCCFLTLSEGTHETFEICPVCNWEDDDVQFNNPDSDLKIEGIALLKTGEASFQRIMAIKEECPEFASMIVAIQEKKLEFYLHVQNYAEAATLLRVCNLDAKEQVKGLAVLLDQAWILKMQRRSQEAINLLEKANDAMSDFAYREMLIKFRDFLIEEPNRSVSLNWLTIGDKLAIAMAQVPLLQELQLSIETECFQFSIATNEFYKAKRIYDRVKIFPGPSASLQSEVVNALLPRGDKISARELHFFSELFDLQNHQKIKQYKKVLNGINDCSTIDKVKSSITALERLIQLVSAENGSSFSWMEEMKSRLYLQVGQMHMAKGDQSEALKAFAVTEKWAERFMNYEILDIINFLKKRIKN